MRRYSKPRKLKLSPSDKFTVRLFSSLIVTLSLASSCRNRFSTAFTSHPCRGWESINITRSSAKRGGLNGWTQHLLAVYSPESENLRSFSGVDLSATLLCPDGTGYSRTGRFSSGSIVVIAHSCFRSSRAAKDFADHRNRLSHPWPR